MSKERYWSASAGRVFGDESEYGVRHTHSGYAVVRGDGSYAEFLDSEEAEEAAEALANGDASDSDYDWIDQGYYPCAWCEGTGTIEDAEHGDCECSHCDGTGQAGDD